MDWVEKDDMKRLVSGARVAFGVLAIMVQSLSTGTLLAAPGDAIAPVEVRACNARESARVAANLFNATGMADSETTLGNGSANNVSWCTGQGDGSALATAGKLWVVIDLGASYPLGELNVWNYNWLHTDHQPEYMSRGWAQFDVLVRDTEADTDIGTAGGTPINVDGGISTAMSPAVFNLGSSDPWQVTLADQAIAQAPGTAGYTATSYDLSGHTARFIALRADSVQPDDTVGIGLGKIRIIEGTAPPQGAVLSVR